jgi:hypothetical protein
MVKSVDRDGSNPSSLPRGVLKRSTTFDYAYESEGAFGAHQNVLVASDLFLQAGRHLLF